MENRKRVFVSVPMHGKTDDEIRRSIQIAIRDYCEARNVSPREVEFVYNFFEDAEDKALQNLLLTGVKHDRISKLGDAILLLANCDEAVLGKNWILADGCVIEKDICLRYNIPIVMMNYVRREPSDEKWLKRHKEWCEKYPNVTVVWKKVNQAN